MKILCLSFLRLGDIYMQAHIIRQIQVEYPEAEIDIVCFQEFKEAHHAFTEVNQWYYLSRSALQNSLVKNEQSIWNAFKILKNMTTLLQGNKYDLVFDLSHTQFSYLFFCLLKPQVEYRKYHNDVYLENDYKSVNSEKRHWIEAFKENLGLKNETKTIRTTFQSIQEVDFVKDVSSPYKDSKEKIRILLQLNTSDVKKNWGNIQARQLIAELNSYFGEQQIDILSSPTEEAYYKSFVNSKQIKIWDLKQVQDHFQNYDLLVTLDTSISHLAALKGSLQILLISLGSSHSIKTSPYREDIFILESTVGCFPCNHSSQCSQMTHRCSLAIEASDVFNSIKYILFRHWHDLSFLIENKNIRFMQQDIKNIKEVST